MKCPECGCDPTPITIGDGQVEMKPCGRVPASVQSYILPKGVKFDCPMWDWQEGYLACLKDMRVKNE